MLRRSSFGRTKCGQTNWFSKKTISASKNPWWPILNVMKPAQTRMFTIPFFSLSLCPEQDRAERRHRAEIWALFPLYEIAIFFWWRVLFPREKCFQCISSKWRKLDFGRHRAFWHDERNYCHLEVMHSELLGKGNRGIDKESLARHYQGQLEVMMMHQWRYEVGKNLLITSIFSSFLPTIT